MTSQEDLRVFRLIAEHQVKQDKAINHIKMIIWFILGILTYHLIFGIG